MEVTINTLLQFVQYSDSSTVSSTVNPLPYNELPATWRRFEIELNKHKYYSIPVNAKYYSSVIEYIVQEMRTLNMLGICLFPRINY